MTKPNCSNGRYNFSGVDMSALDCWRLSTLLKGTLMVALQAGQNISHPLRLPDFLSQSRAFNWQPSSSIHTDIQ